jgi:hypothetical protein
MNCFSYIEVEIAIINSYFMFPYTLQMHFDPG